MPELRVETGPQKNQTFFLRPPGPYQIGRDLAADYPLFDRRTSRTHFRIDFRDDGYCLTDLASKGGTYVNDELIECAVLKPGDRIVAGRTAFSFAVDCAEDPLIGRTLGGYVILERVGKGGMGTVYRARQQSLERIVALKVLSEEVASDPELCALFVREAKASGELSHPNIVRVYDVDFIDGVLFYVMEFMAHGSVADLLRREGKLPVDRAIRIALQAAQGIEYAEHEKIVHRDIKPSNLMVHESGSIKIGDLGIAVRLAQPKAQPGAGAISGSPHYMAPEQALGRAVDSRADIYSLGATLFHLLSGVPPFRGQSLKEILFAVVRSDPPDLRKLTPEVPEALSVLVGSMLAKDPLRRPSSVAVRQGLEAIRSAESRHAPPPMPDQDPRWKPYAALVVASFLALALGAGVGIFFQHLGAVINGRNVRLERVQAALEDGHRALKAGEVDTARKKLEEISNLPGSLDDWQILQPQIDELKAAVKRARTTR